MIPGTTYQTKKTIRPKKKSCKTKAIKKEIGRKRTKKKKQATENKNKDTLNEDIDKLLEVIEEENASSSKITAKYGNDMTSRSLRSILTVEHRLLNPDNELRRIFGSQALMEDTSFRRRSRARTHKGLWLSQPENNWVKLGKTGISMNLLDTVNGVQYFKLEHSRDYQVVQFKFLDAVDSSDHRNIASVLEKHVYHVDSLVTFSDVYKIHDDVKMARELIERALFCLERSFHTCFNLTTGTCRLPYKYQENRCFFLALYKHMNYVAQRGCNRTSLELAKLLLSLDPDRDPLGVALLLDYFALRAGEYEYLIRFAEEWGLNRNLDQLPNWAFSIALAEFHKSDPMDRGRADQKLQDALIMFPMVLIPLLEKCLVQTDKKVKQSDFFNRQAENSFPPGLKILCHLFVGRNFTLWKDPNVMRWLERNVNHVLTKVALANPCIAECARKRKSRYQKPPLNVYRHAMISEIDGVSSVLPLEIRMGTMLSHDPLPPSDTVTSYERPSRTSPRRSANPVSLFFHSLLPGFDPQHDLDDLDLDVQPEGQGPQLRGNVQTLMNAMRDLLHTFQRPLDGDEAEEEEFENEWD